MDNKLNKIDLAASFMKKPARAPEPPAACSIDANVQTDTLSEETTPEKVDVKESSKKKGKAVCVKKDRSYQPFTVMCDKELVRIIKAIAKKEGLHVNAVVQAMYTEGIRSYELSHGAVDSEPKKKSAQEVLFAK